MRVSNKGYNFCPQTQVVFLNFWLVDDDDFASDDITLGLDNQEEHSLCAEYIKKNLLLLLPQQLNISYSPLYYLLSGISVVLPSSLRSVCVYLFSLQRNGILRRNKICLSLQIYLQQSEWDGLALSLSRNLSKLGKCVRSPTKCGE